MTKNYRDMTYRRIGLFMLILLLASAGLSGCWAPVAEHVRATDPSSDPDYRVATSKETKSDLVVDAAASKSSIDIDLHTDKLCREVAKTRMRRAQRAEHTLTTEGKSAQYANVLASALFFGYGAWALAGECPGSTTSQPAPTAKDPKATTDVTQPCSASADKNFRASGAVSIGLGLIPATLFIVNAIRASDEDSWIPAETKTDSKDWTACGSSPAANRDLVVTFSDGTKADVSIDENGHGVLNLTTLRLSDQAFANPEAEIRVKGKDDLIGTVRWSSTDVYASWKDEQDKAKAEKIRLAEERRAEREAEAKRAADEAKRKAEEAFRKKLIAAKKWPEMTVAEFGIRMTDVLTVLGNGAGQQLSQGDMSGFRLAMAAGFGAMTCSFSNPSAQRNGIALLMASAQKCFELGESMFPDAFVVVDSTHIKVSPQMKILFDRASKVAVVVRQNNYVVCVQTCLQEHAFSTRDHCEAKCSN